MALCLCLAWYVRQKPIDGQPSSQAHGPQGLGTVSSTDSVETGGETGLARVREAASRLILVVDGSGTGIAGASVMLSSKVERATRVAGRQILGATSLDGQLLVPEQAILDSKADVIAARATGYLPASIPIAGAGTSPITLVLQPESRQELRCIDLNGDPVPGLCIVASRMDIPRTYCDRGIDPDLEPGLDPVNALQAQQSNSAGQVTFGELVPGRYLFMVESEYYENVDYTQFSFVVPGPTVVVRVTPLLCAVVQVVGDDIYSWGYTGGDSSVWLTPSNFSRSLDALKQRLKDRYPGSFVLVGGCKSASSVISSVPVDLLLARTGKRHVEVPLAPAFVDPVPIVVEVPPGEPGQESISTLRFVITDSAGRTVPCSDFFASKDTLVFPVEVPIADGRAVPLPHGRWSITTHSPFLRGHFQPEFFEHGMAGEVVSIQIDASLTPVRVVAQGYRDEPPTSLLVQVTCIGLHGNWGTENPGSLTLWLPPGDADWSLGAMGYEPCHGSEPVRQMSGGDSQVIDFKLELAHGH